MSFKHRGQGFETHCTGRVRAFASSSLVYGFTTCSDNQKGYALRPENACTLCKIYKSIYFKRIQLTKRRTNPKILLFLLFSSKAKSKIGDAFKEGLEKRSRDHCDFTLDIAEQRRELRNGLRYISHSRKVG